MKQFGLMNLTILGDVSVKLTSIGEMSRPMLQIVNKVLLLCF